MIVLEARGGGRGVGDLHDGESELQSPGEKNAVLNADASGSFSLVISCLVLWPEVIPS